MPAKANRLIMIIGLQAGKDYQKFPVHLRMTQVSGLTLGYDRDVRDQAELLIVISEQVANPALEPVSTDSIANFTTHGHPKTRAVPPRVHYHYKMGCVIMLSLLPGSLIITGTADPAKPFKGLITLHPSACCYFTGIDTAKDLRPRARRRLITFDPLFERMRLRKP